MSLEFDSSNNYNKTIALPHNIYVISGLGADERVFHKLEFGGVSPTFIKWIDPNKRETLEEYATRLREQITTSNPVLIGLSFGGIMAIEIAKQIKTEKIILLASAKTKFEIPSYYRSAGRIKLYNYIPAKLLKKTNFIVFWFFGAKTEEDKNLLKRILLDTDPKFFKWAIDKISRWKNELILDNILHIHGTSDRIFPIKNVRCDLKIKGGGHLMTLDKADELNEILNKNLSKSSYF